MPIFLFAAVKPQRPAYPSSKAKVDWDRLEAEVKKEVQLALKTEPPTSFVFNMRRPSDAFHLFSMSLTISRIACLILLQEKEEKLDGDAALNKLFREIYSDADEDMRRAMLKSFVRYLIPLNFLYTTNRNFRFHICEG